MGIYPEETMHRKDVCTPTFIAPFTTAKTWKQPKRPSTEGWEKKTWCIYTVEYYSVVNNNGTLLFAATWMDLEMIIPSELSRGRRSIL